MSNKNSRGSRRPAGRERRLSIRAVRRNEPDMRKLGRALIELAMAQAEAEAEAENGRTSDSTTPSELSRSAEASGVADD